MKDKEIQDTVIKKIQDRTNQFIAMEGRPEKLFSVSQERAVLLVVDMQKFVCAPDKGRGLPGIKTVVENTNKLVDSCHDKEIPVIWVRHHIPPDGDQGLYPLFHNEEHINTVECGSPETEIYERMHVDESIDHIVFKERYSAFMPDPSKSGLRKTLLKLGRNQLIVCGMATNVCVESTVRDAMQMDYEVMLVSDATDTYAEVIRESSLSSIRLLFGDVRSSVSILNEINAL